MSVVLKTIYHWPPKISGSRANSGVKLSGGATSIAKSGAATAGAAAVTVRARGATMVSTAVP